jgi:ferritin-like protein
MISAYEEVLSKSLTALQTDELIRGYLYKITSGGEYIPEEEIAEHISRVKKLHEDLHIRIVQTRVKGKILIEIKGGLEKSSEMIRKIIRKLDE